MRGEENKIIINSCRALNRALVFITPALSLLPPSLHYKSNIKSNTHSTFQRFKDAQVFIGRESVAFF